MDTKASSKSLVDRALPPASPLIEIEHRYGADNYAPLPVVMSHGEGVWLWDENGRRYLDMLSAYSAVSHGHAHPRIVRALVEQAQRLAMTSRACSFPSKASPILM